MSVECKRNLDLIAGTRYIANFMGNDGRETGGQDRKARLAEALRANLRRRKAQGRARKLAPGASKVADGVPVPAPRGDLDTPDEGEAG